MATVDREDRVLATAQRIVNSLRTSQDVTDDMLLILSSFDNRLSDLIPHRNSVVDDGLFRRFESSEKVILRYDSPSNRLFDPCSNSVDDCCQYLAAVDDLLDLTSNLRINDNGGGNGGGNGGDHSINNRIESVVQCSMEKLQDELQRLLMNNVVPLDADRLYGSIRRVTLPVCSQDSDLIEGEFGNFNSSYVHEKGGSIAGDVSVDLITPDVISDIRDIADRMIRAGYEKECCQVFSNARRVALEEFLGILEIEKLSIEDVHRIEWNLLDEKMKIWAQGVKIVIRVLLNGEKHLCEQIFDGYDLIREVCFVETAKGCVMQLLNFGEAIAIGKSSPEKLFRILDMYEAVRDTLPCLQGLFADGSGEFICSEAKGVLDALGEAANRTFVEFEIAVKGEGSRKPVHGAEIHPISRYVMNYVKLIVDYSNTLNSLLESDANEKEDGNCRGGSNGEGSSEINCLGKRLMSLISSLESNLEEKAKSYDDNAMQYIFLMNNKLYIVQKVKDSELGKLLGYDWVKRRRGTVRKYATNYLRASWSRVLACLRDEGIGGSSGSSFKIALKERFKNFNANFEEIYRTQTAWKVPDSQLKTELRISISEMVLPAYRSFVGRFGTQIDTGRNAGKHIKYTTEDLECYLGDLFQGTPGVIHHIRRKSS